MTDDLDVTMGAEQTDEGVRHGGRILLAGEHDPTVARINYYPPDDENPARIQLQVEAFQCGATSYPTPDAARRLAAELVRAANEADVADARQKL